MYLQPLHRGQGANFKSTLLGNISFEINIINKIIVSNWVLIVDA